MPSEAYIKELSSYKGITPVPKDFNEYWEFQAVEASKMELSYTLKEVPFHNSFARYYDLTFKSIDGTLVYAKYVRPNHEEKTPLVLQFHDYPNAGRSWFQMTRYPGIGYSVLAMDCRGQGGRSRENKASLGSMAGSCLIQGLDGPIDSMYYRNVYLDAFLLSRIGEQLSGTDPSKLAVLGDGQGGSLAIVCAALKQSIQKCIALNPCLSDFKKLSELGCNTSLNEVLDYYFRWCDPLHEREDEIFTKLGYIDIKNFAPLLKAELLMGTGLLDTISPPPAQYAVYNQAECRKSHKVFPKFVHEPIFKFENIYLSFLQF